MGYPSASSWVQGVDADTLRTWHDILGGSSSRDVQMVYTVNTAAAETLARLSRAPRIPGLGLSFSTGWNETTDRQLGRFVGEWGPARWSDVIFRAHTFHVSPLYKMPNSTLKSNKDWAHTDFEALAPGALPVTAYKPAGDRVAYDANYTHWNKARTPARDHYRVAWRRMAANTGERTLIPAIIPPRCCARAPSHISWSSTPPLTSRRHAGSPQLAPR